MKFSCSNYNRDCFKNQSFAKKENNKKIVAIRNDPHESTRPQTSIPSIFPLTHWYTFFKGMPRCWAIRLQSSYSGAACTIFPCAFANLTRMGPQGLSRTREVLAKRCTLADNARTPMVLVSENITSFNASHFALSQRTFKRVPILPFFIRMGWAYTSLAPLWSSFSIV